MTRSETCIGVICDVSITLSNCPKIWVYSIRQPSGFLAQASKDQRKTYRLAVIPGDGIGKETTPEGVRVLEAAASSFGFELQLDHFDFASYDYYTKRGRMLPEDWKKQIGSHDAIFFGAVGWPEKIPDHVSLWGSLLQFRREFDQYINLRPVRLMPGVPTPLANRKPGEIDFWVVRENTEGEYSSIGGKMFGPVAKFVRRWKGGRIGVVSGLGCPRGVPGKSSLIQKTPRPFANCVTGPLFRGDRGRRELAGQDAPGQERTKRK
jgi:hypothetical protein